MGAGLRVGSPAAPWLWGTPSLTGCVMPLGGAQACRERSWGAGSHTAREEVCVSGHTALPQFPLDSLQNLQKPRRALAMLFCPRLGRRSVWALEPCLWGRGPQESFLEASLLGFQALHGGGSPAAYSLLHAADKGDEEGRGQ